MSSFSVPPPPPRYAIHNAHSITQQNGMSVPPLETINALSHPSGPETQLAVGEGTFILRDVIHLATPPPHPSEAPITNINPLATTPAAPTSGVKLSLVIISPRRPASRLYKYGISPGTRSTFVASSIKESDQESIPSNETSSDGNQSHAASGSSTPAFGEGNHLLGVTAGGKEVSKRKKPKTNILKSNSSLISRVVPHEAYSKRVQEHSADGLLLFANVNRAFQWLDLSSPTPAKADHLMKILFTKAHMLCHDVNMFTKNTGHLDVVMGSSMADILWYEPFSQKYNRINKNGIINTSAVSCIRWIPGSETLFLASHMDGTLLVYDKERDDAAFVSEEDGEDRNGDSEQLSLHINKSVNSRNQKTNPVASWNISNQRINEFAFSPDSRHLAVVCEDGTLRIIDYLKEQLTDLYTSYYGGLICVCWSPDGKYILTGGQDDLVSIWSLVERRIIARCPGHRSWVTAVAFDPWRCDDRDYRFGSVGEDRRLLLWDFNVGMLHRPKAAYVRQRGSISSYAPGNRHRTESQLAARYRSNSNLTSQIAEDQDLIEHAVESRTVTAELPPVLSKVIDEHPLSWMGFEEDCVITACTEGHVRTWDRPTDTGNQSQITVSVG